MLSRDTLDAALAPARAALRWGAAFTAVAAVVAALASGASAAVATLAGGAIGLLAGRSMAAGLVAAFAGAETAAGAAEAGARISRASRAGRRIALVGAVLRYPLMGTVLAACIMVLDLPAGWLAVGVTAWPASLLAAALKLQAAGSLHPEAD